MNETVSMEVVLEMRDYIRQLEQKLADKQDKKCENCGEFGECCEKQELVVQQCKGIPRNGCDYLTACDTVCNKCGEIHHHHQMVAQFAPPPQRQWVGLTELDFEIAYRDYRDIGTQNGFNKVVEQLETKLKEKNNG